MYLLTVFLSPAEEKDQRQNREHRQACPGVQEGGGRFRLVQRGGQRAID